MKRISKFLALIMCMAFVIMTITPNTAYAATSVGQAVVKSVKADKKTYLPVITWETVKGADGYVIYRKGFTSWIKVGTTKKTSFTDPSAVSSLLSTKADLGEKIKLQYRVKAYVKNGKKTTYGKVSKTKIFKAERYMYDNKLASFNDYGNNVYDIIKADLPDGFTQMKGSLVGDEELYTSLYTVLDNMFNERQESEEGRAYLAEYDKYVADADELFDKMCNTDSEEEYNKYSLEYSAACKAYSEVYDKFAAPFTELEDLVTKASAYYNNLKDEKGNAVSTLDDIKRIIKNESTGGYTGWLMNFDAYARFPGDAELTTPSGYNVSYNDTDYELYVYVPLNTLDTYNMYREKGVKAANDDILRSIYMQFVFRRFEDGHRVKPSDMNLTEIDKLIKNTKLTPVAAVKMPTE